MVVVLWVWAGSNLDMWAMNSVGTSWESVRFGSVCGRGEDCPTPWRMPWTGGHVAVATMAAAETSSAAAIFTCSER